MELLAGPLGALLGAHLPFLDMTHFPFLHACTLRLCVLRVCPLLEATLQ